MEETGEFSLDFDRDFHRVRSGFGRTIGTAGINDPDFLVENIARIESIKVQLLTSVVLAETQKGAILRDLEILRNSLLQFSSATGQWDAKRGLDPAPQPVSVGLPGAMKMHGILGQERSRNWCA